MADDVHLQKKLLEHQNVTTDLHLFFRISLIRDTKESYRVDWWTYLGWAAGDLGGFCATWLGTAEAGAGADADAWVGAGTGAEKKYIFSKNQN